MERMRLDLQETVLQSTRIVAGNEAASDEEV